MRPLAALVLSIATMVCVGTASAASYGPAAQTYSVTATATANGQLTGTESISFGNSTGAPISEVWLRLWANLDECGQRHITVSNMTGGSVVATANTCTAIKVLLATPLQPGATAQLGLHFAIRLPRANARLGTANGASYYGDALPVLATTRDGSPLLTPDNEIGDPFVASMAAWTIDLTWPATLAAATGGTPTSVAAPAGQRRAVFSSPAARDVAIAIGPWREQTTTAAGTRVRILAPAGVASRGLLDATRTSLTRMSERYGTLGLSTFDVIITPGLDSYGMEYAGLVLTEPSKETLVHEVAHQWFSQLVGDDGFAEPWLDEGTATYAQLRDMGQLGSCNLSKPFAGYGSARLTWSLAQFSRHIDWYDAVYDGAACALAKLDRDWGKGAVDGILRTWVERYRNGIATTADFIALLRERAPAGYDVDGFLRYARLTS
ncbi:MAG: M1 family aminopeptidase [Thermoleophilia bacterium]